MYGMSARVRACVYVCVRQRERERERERYVWKGMVMEKERGFVT